MKKWVFIMLSVFLCMPFLTSCDNVEKGTKTVLIYMCGSSLETKNGAATKNIEELLSCKIPDNVNLIIETGGAEKWRDYNIDASTLSRYRIQNGTLTLLENVEDASMGEKSTLSDFLKYGIERYPAEKMGVILWNHGGGSLNGVCFDEKHSNDSLTRTELTEAISEASKQLDDKFELIGFDACLMADYEICAGLSDYANYMVASQEIEPTGGWDYTSLIKGLAAEKFDGAGVGKSICNGYYQKCISEGVEKEATLSVMDLGKIKESQESFDLLIRSMEKESSKIANASSMVTAAFSAEKYGGATGSEGYSNLIDLKTFSESIAQAEGIKDEFGQVLEKAVVYKVAGEQKKNASGISIYYPLSYDEKNVTKYLEETSLQAYQNMLKKMYTDIPKKTIEFENAGRKNKKGEFEIKLKESSLPYVRSVNFALLEFDQSEDYQEQITCLGKDNDIKEADNGTYQSNFRGVWLSFGDTPLFFEAIERAKRYVVFSSPIRLNGKKTFLRFSYIFDNSKEGGHYELIGTWDGIGTSGLSQKKITRLQNDDVITPIYKTENRADFSKRNVDGKYFTYNKSKVISEQPLKKKYYQYVYVITDIFGKSYYSKSAVIERTMTEKDIIKNAVLPESKSAGKIIAVSDDVGNDMTYFQ